MQCYLLNADAVADLELKPRKHLQIVPLRIRRGVNKGLLAVPVDAVTEEFSPAAWQALPVAEVDIAVETARPDDGRDEAALVDAALVTAGVKFRPLRPIYRKLFRSGKADFARQLTEALPLTLAQEDTRTALLAIFDA